MGTTALRAGMHGICMDAWCLYDSALCASTRSLHLAIAIVNPKRTATPGELQLLQSHGTAALCVYNADVVDKGVLVLLGCTIAMLARPTHGTRKGSLDGPNMEPQVMAKDVAHARSKHIEQVRFYRACTLNVALQKDWFITHMRG